MDGGWAAAPGRRRVWRAAGFPIAVWAAWRAAHLLAVVVWGGDPVDATFAFDGAWMRSVLEQGYIRSDPTYTVPQNLPFLPGMPWLTAPVALALPTGAAAMVVANLAGLAAFVSLWAVLRALAGEVTARRGVVALALWPGSLVLWAYMSEAAFMTATALAALADLRRRPGLAALAAVAAGTLRVVGFVVGPALAVARVARLRRVDLTAVAYAASGLLSAGLVGFTQHRAVGDALAFSRAQQAWDRSIAVPGTGVVRGVIDLVTALPEVRLEVSMNVASVVLAVGALVLVTRRVGLAAPASAAVTMAWAVLIVALASDLVSSQVRYVLGAWPALLVLDGDEGRTRLPRSRRALVAVAVGVAVGVSLVVSQRWATGAFVA